MTAPAADDARPTWWQAYPSIWEAETLALTAAGARWRDASADGCTDVRAAVGEDWGRDSLPRELEISWPHPAPRPGEPAFLELTAWYPETYPWLPPEVALPDPLPGLSRHRSPDGGMLCLLASVDDWQPGTTVAALLLAQLPRLLAAERAPVDDPGVAALEAGAHPVWGRVHLGLGGILVDTDWVIPADVSGGTADLAVVTEGRPWPVRAVTEIRDHSGQPIAALSVGLAATATVPWVRVPELPEGVLAPEELWRLAALQWPGPPGCLDGEPHVLVLLPSEGASRRAREDWMLLRRRDLFAQVTPEPPGAPAVTAKPETGELGSPDLVAAPGPTAPTAPVPAVQADLPSTGARLRGRFLTASRGYGVGPGDLTARLPAGDADLLAGASVAVIGVGALGGTIAFELARAGVGQLTLVDGDLVDPATSSRQLPGWVWTGLPKVVAVSGLIAGHTPHTEVRAVCRHLGRDMDAVEDLSVHDLVIDATASTTTTRLLAAHLRLWELPLLVASATAGGWGGCVVTLPASHGGCWECLALHRTDRTVPWPPAAPGGPIVPIGCSEPTFVGAAPDLGHVALQATRTALNLLTDDPAAVAPVRTRQVFPDLQVLTLQTPAGPCLPSWAASPLTVHPECPLHPQGDDWADGTSSARRRGDNQVTVTGARSRRPGAVDVDALLGAS